jgi:hypothetical protein
MDSHEAGFPPFPHSLEIPLGFPHSHGLDDWIYVFSCLLNSNRRHRKGLVTDLSGPQRNACPGTLIAAFTLKRVAPGYVSNMRRTVRTPVPAPMKVSEGNSSQIPPRASTIGLSLSFCLGPLAQMATSRPPGFNIFNTYGKDSCWIVTLAS